VVDTSGGIYEEKRESLFENYVQVKEGHNSARVRLGSVQSIVSGLHLLFIC
jgi:hypothetical protein